MAFQSVPNTAEAAVQFTLNNVTCFNTYQFEKSTGYNQSDLDALAGVVDTWAGLTWVPLLSSTIGYTQTIVRGLEDENDLTALANADAATGGVGSLPLPNNNSIALKRVSGFTGRSARGRIYVVGLPTSYVSGDENFLTTASITDFLDALDDLIAAADAIGWVAVVVSRFLNGVKRAVGVTFDILQYEADDARIDSRRDRLPGN